MSSALTFLRLNMVEEISSDHWYSHRGHSFFTCQYLKYVHNPDFYRNIFYTIIFGSIEDGYTVAMDGQLKCFKIHIRNRLTN
jgi:hypothetical protein